MADQCEHLTGLRTEDFPPQKDLSACEECLVEGTFWVALRECRSCGHVGCCDSSEGKHATKHFHTTHHPIVESFEPEEEWGWCYVHEEFLDLPAEVLVEKR